MTQQQTANNQQKSSQEAVTRETVRNASDLLSLKQSGFRNTLKKLFGMRKSVEAASIAETLSKIDSFTTSVETMTNAPFKSSSDELNKAVDSTQSPLKEDILKSTKSLREGIADVLASSGTTPDEFQNMSPKERAKLVRALPSEKQVTLRDLLKTEKAAIKTALTQMRDINDSVEKVLKGNPSPEITRRFAEQLNKTIPRDLYGAPTVPHHEVAQAVKKATEQASFEIESEVIELNSQHLLKVLEETKNLLNPPAAGSSTGLVQTSAADITLEIPTSLAQELQQMVEAKTNQEKQDLEKALQDYSQNRNADTIEAVTQAEAKLREKFEEAHKILIGVADELQDVAPTYTPASGRHSNGLVPKDNALDEKVKELKQQGVDPAIANELFKAGERLTDVYSDHIQSMLRESPETVTSEEIHGTLESLRKRKKQLLEVEPADVEQVSLKLMHSNSQHRREIEDELKSLHGQVKAARSAAQNKGADDDELSLD